MGLFKDVKKPTLKVVGSTGANISQLRPQYTPKAAPCGAHCPSGSDIRSWLTTIAQADSYGRSSDEAYELAWRKIVERNPFPAVCGRVCPHPCEDSCNRGAKEGPVAINALERFVGDFGIGKGLKLGHLTAEQYPERIGVIGAGPAGLSCAYQLARRGYSVTVFEAFAKPGGMLRYGIPAYRLPREVLDAEIQRILDAGVKLKCNASVSVESIRSQFNAVFVGVGAHKGLKLGVPGEDSPNVFTGTEFLNQVNSGETVGVGSKVLVVGGGDTAIDAARMARRLGAEVTILYRRTRAEMPAIRPEIDGAIEEGVRIEFLAAPVEVLTEDGVAVAVRCIRMELGEPDRSGRPRPVPKPGSEFDLQTSAVIAAISQEPAAGWLKADAHGATDQDSVWTGGDDLGLGLVTIAISQGRFAAEAIDARLRGRHVDNPAQPTVVTKERVKLGWYKESARHERTNLPVDERHMNTEIERGLADEDALAEAKRCMSCGLCMDCETCWMYCTNSCFVKLPKGEHYRIKLELCNGCKKCAEECPCGYIDLV